MRKKFIILAGLVILILAPFAGGLMRGLPDRFSDYPPLVVNPPVHASFSPWVFSAYAVLFLVAVTILVWPRAFGFIPVKGFEIFVPGRFPFWGWIGLLMLAASWIGAWGQFHWLGFMRRHMFAPLWLGYVLLMDALVYHRKRTSILVRSPATFLSLFPASAISWWYYEYLNRFMQNWWYQGIENFTPFHYIVYSSICFSTVLPAIFETTEWLTTFSWFRSMYAVGMKWREVRVPPMVFIVMGSVGLVVMTAFPEPMFCLVWLAPMLVLSGLLSAMCIATPFTQAADGNYTQLTGLAVAALICGFWWELWNFGSLPRWQYSIPFVDRWPLFEMPILGYSGYLPFGPVCYLFWLLLSHLLPERMRGKLQDGLCV